MELAEFIFNLKVSLKQKYKDIQPVKVYNNIHDTNTINYIKKELKNFGGIYGFLCKNNNKIYIGSSVNLVNRFMEHRRGKKSNIKLQRAILKYGLSNFYYIVFEFHNAKDENLLVIIESLFLSYFKLRYLYNFKSIATSMLGYKHNSKAKAKMKERYKLYKHPFLGKHHHTLSKKKISLATQGINNPMFGKKHSNKAKYLMSIIKSKPVYFYKLIYNKFELIEIYPNSIYVAKLLNLHKTTIGNYIKNRKIITWKSNKCILTRTLIHNNINEE
jgi:group I intron endonuclease